MTTPPVPLDRALVEDLIALLKAFESDAAPEVQIARRPGAARVILRFRIREAVRLRVNLQDAIADAAAAG